MRTYEIETQGGHILVVVKQGASLLSLYDCGPTRVSCSAKTAAIVLHALTCEYRQLSSMQRPVAVRTVEVTDAA